MDEQDDGVKILFRFYSDLLEEDTVEMLWGSAVDEKEGHYVLESIPFYAPLVAAGDIVHASWDEDEESLVYRSTVQHSGNSTVQVVLLREGGKIDEICKNFEALGCYYEQRDERYFAMEIPADVDYRPIKKKLEELENNEVIGYAEPCLSPRHMYE